MNQERYAVRLPLEVTADRYGDAWNRHDVDAILALHTDDAVFENHTSGGIAVGKVEIRRLLEGVFATFPDLRFTKRRAYFGEEVAVLEWTATATHARPIARGARTFPPTGKTLAWNGMDVLPFRDGLIARKDVYADSISF
ncbi:MAG TPA: nuclear transport factor 2 family protein, partial [Polyangiaceae bacterium]